MASQSILQTRSAGRHVTLLTLSWGAAPTVKRYARWTSPLFLNPDFFETDPLLEFEFKKAIGGGTDDAEVEIRMDAEKSPANRLRLPYKHAPVSIVLEEADPSDESSRRVIFTGQVSKTTINPRSKPGLLKLTCSGLKARMKDIQLGVLTSSGCQLDFGDAICGFDLAANTLSGTVAELQPGGVLNRLNISFSGSPNLDNARFTRGRVVIDGLGIQIRRSFANGTNPNPTHSFDLKDLPPPWWIGQTCNVEPGCRKSLDACRDPFRDREESFLAPGLFMPNYNPGFEDAQ